MQPNTLTVDEIRDSGILQEVNRQFFHPLGLALAVNMPEGTLTLIDARDQEGWIFGDGVMEPDKHAKFEEFRRAKHEARARLLGFVIQPPAVAL